MLAEKYGDDRRTEIVNELPGQFTDEQLVADEDVVITLSSRNYAKRMPLSTYRQQHRGGRGVIGMQTRDEDDVQHLVIARNHDRLYVFTDRGRVFAVKGTERKRGRGDELSKGVPALKADPGLAHRLLDNCAGLPQPPCIARRGIGFCGDLAHSLGGPFPLYVPEEGGLAGQRRFDLRGHAAQAVEEGSHVGLSGAAGGPVRERRRYGNVESKRRVLERLLRPAHPPRDLAIEDHGLLCHLRFELPGTLRGGLRECVGTDLEAQGVPATEQSALKCTRVLPRVLVGDQCLEPSLLERVMEIEYHRARSPEGIDRGVGVGVVEKADEPPHDAPVAHRATIPTSDRSRV